MVQQLVQLDRLPKENPIEGLLLLRSAWRDYDVARLLAVRYKIICKATYLLQLLLGCVAVSLSGFAPSSSDGETTGTTNSFGTMTPHIVFSISVSMTLIVATDSILNSHSRWRHLRVGAGTLESIIWKYRTRTGIFGIDEKDERDPEINLLASLKKTRTATLTSANLATSELAKNYSTRVYKHFQDSGEPSAPRWPLPADADARHTKEVPIDDHQSPVQPHKYIALRVEPTLTFYQRRIPMYARRTALLKLIIILLGVSASVLARYEQIMIVIIVTSAAAAITSWSEFADTQRKTERYTRAVLALRDLVDWWRALSETEKVGKSNINTLIETAESIINAEQAAWTSTPTSEKEDKSKKTATASGSDINKKA